ncbi:PepSY domain-containing protein, partial [bacterium]|nr:PepSY domain-containing protein [bacterium]
MLFFIFLSPLSLRAQQSKKQMESVKRFKEAHGTAWTIRWHPGARTPSIIYGSKTKPDQEIRSFNGDEKVSRKFLSTFRDLFKIRDVHDEWVLEKKESYAGMKYIDLAQTYRGIKVYSGSYTLSMEGDGGIRTIAGKFYPDIDISIKPKITSTHSLQKACEYLKIPASPADPQLVIYPTELGGLRYYDEMYALAYEMNLSTQEGSWHVLVDAISGDIIQSESTVCHASGNVYMKDPGNTPNLTQVTLLRPTGQSKLEGQYVRVYNHNGSSENESVTQATEPSGNFLYNAANGKLDEVNVYYHADKYFHWFVSTFGLANTNYFNIDVHYGIGWNAWANPDANPQHLRFEDGDEIKARGLSRKD